MKRDHAWASAVADETERRLGRPLADRAGFIEAALTDAPGLLAGVRHKLFGDHAAYFDRLVAAAGDVTV